MLSTYLPSESEAWPWKANDAPQDFRGDDLYSYIDGGAEIYREYGFVEVLVQEYKNQEGKALSLEVFQMTSPESAYGIYTFKRSTRGQPFDVDAAEGQLEDYYLNVWKGRFVVTITDYGRNPENRRNLVGLALAVSKKIPDHSALPSLVSELPQTGLIQTSIRYFRGYLGFMNNYASPGAESFHFKEGVKGEYRSGASLFILKNPSKDESVKSFSAVVKAFRSTSSFRKFKLSSPLDLRALDDRGKLVSVRVVEDELLVCLEDTDGSEASKLFTKFGQDR